MRSRLVLCLLIVAALALPAATATAAPPANDAFSAPATLTSGAPAQLGDNLDATAEPSEISYSSSRWNDCPAFDTRADCGNSDWYAFTAPATDSYTIDTCDKGTEVDTVLVAFSGNTLGGLTKLQDNDDFCDGGYNGNGSSLTIAATAGETYRIQVTGFGGQQGTFYLRAHPSASPPPAPAVDTRITRNQSIVSDAPSNNGNGTHSGGRRTASFAFVSSSATATYECALDAAAFTPCSSPMSYGDVAADGSQHAFRVRSTAGAATDATPAVQKFTIDRTPPDTTLTTGPAEGDTLLGAAVLGNVSTERTPVRSARCAVDAGEVVTCPSGTFSIGAFCDGPHSASVQAMDEAGNLDPTPAIRSFISSAGQGPCTGPSISADPAATSPTSATLNVIVTSGGAPVAMTVRFGTTTAYGETSRQRVNVNETTPGTLLTGLAPSTVYHYEATVRTPAGATATTGDQTFATDPLPGGDAVPTAELGTPIVTGPHSARIPFTLTGGTTTGSVSPRLYISTGAVTRNSPILYVDGDSVATPSFPVASAIDAVDLEPATTYHYRLFLDAGYTALSEERTFTTPAASVVTPVVTPAGGPAPPPAKPAAAPFRLKAGNLSIGAFKRSARKVSIKVKGVPSGTKLVLKIKGAKALATAKATASKAGTATFKVKLGAKARKALKSRRLKRLTFTVTATPPGGKATTVTVTKRLK